MTNDQCTEVAEKVWGWDEITMQDRFDAHNHGLSSSNLMFFGNRDNWLEDEVHSWEGFGRTVEAIDATDSEYYGDSLNSYIRGEITKTELWERTHLAALEAIK